MMYSESVLPVKGSSQGLLLALSVREENLGTLLLEDASTKDIKRMKVGESNFMKVVKECVRCLDEEASAFVKSLHDDDLECVFGCHFGFQRFFLISERNLFCDLKSLFR